MRWMLLSLALALPSLAAAQEPAPAPTAADAPTLAAPPAPSTSPSLRLLPEGSEVPYRGGPVPRGAHVLGRKNVPLLVAGAAVFGLGYLGALLGSWSAGFAPGLDLRKQGADAGPAFATGVMMLVPLVGPGGAALVSPSLRQQHLLPVVLDVVVQVAGAVLLGTAIFGPVERVLHYDQAGPEPEAQP